MISEVPRFNILINGVLISYQSGTGKELTTIIVTRSKFKISFKYRLKDASYCAKNIIYI